MNKVVEQIIKKELFKRGGIMASKEAVERAYKALAAKMEPLGLDITAIKSEADYNRALGFIKSLEDQVFAKKFGDTLSKKDIAKVFDLEGRQLDTKKPIMGGTQSEEDILQKSIKKNVAEATKKGDFTGIANQVLRDPDIAREFAMMKRFPTKTAEGEEAIPIAMKAKFDDEMGIKSLPDRDYSVEKLVSDFRKFGKATDKDIQMILGSGKSGQIPYVMDNYGMSYTDVINTLKRGDPLIEGMATGGRAGFKVGSTSKRAFLKVMGGLAATIAAIKSGLIGTSGKEVTKQVVKESAKDVANAPPSYFFDLANKIKKLGKESKVKPQERVNEYNYKGKDGSEYTLTEDISTGDMQIVKDKGGVGVADDKTFDTIEDRTVMDFKKGRGDETTKGTPADEYDEYKVEFDMDGTPADADDISEIVKKEIIEEASEIPEKKIKRASGGVAYMLGE